jgi:hypothetical protein
MNWIRDIHYNLEKNIEKVDSNVIESDTTFYTSYLDYYMKEEEPVFSPDICLYLILRECQIKPIEYPERFEVLCDMLSLKRSTYKRDWMNIPKKMVKLCGSRQEWEYVMRVTQTLKNVTMSNEMEGYQWKWFMDLCYCTIQNIIDSKDFSVLSFFFYKHEYQSDVWYGTWTDEYENMYIKVMGFVSGGQYGEISYQVYNKHIFECL